MSVNTPLTLALPSKGRLKEQTEAWLADCGLGLDVDGGARGYRASLRGVPGIEVRLLSAADIAQALHAGDIQLGLTGEDLLREEGEELESRLMLLRALGFGRADVVVAAPQSWIDVETMADVDDVAHDYLARTGSPLRVATKYQVQTRAFFAAHGIADYRIVESLGATEGAPAASWAWLFRMTPSPMIFRLLAARVAPVVVMSTISSATPAAGAPSVAPRDSTMR